MTDENELPLPGATVVVENTTRGVSTDFDGNYSIKASENEVLIFSFVGYTDQKITIDSADSYDVSLQPGNQLEEVVLTALGIEKRKDDDLSGTSVVEVDQLQRSGETGVLQGLSGKASGVQITRNSGDPGSGAYIQIRGQNTINGDNSPLIILDGNVTRALDTHGNSAVYASYFLNDGDRVLLNTDDGGRFSQTSSMKLASYVENQLILAEAKFKTGNEAGAR